MLRGGAPTLAVPLTAREATTTTTRQARTSTETLQHFLLIYGRKLPTAEMRLCFRRPPPIQCLLSKTHLRCATVCIKTDIFNCLWVVVFFSQTRVLTSVSNPSNVMFVLYCELSSCCQLQVGYNEAGQCRVAARCSLVQFLVCFCGDCIALQLISCVQLV